MAESDNIDNKEKRKLRNINWILLRREYAKNYKFKS